jgi:hypothetical protein
MDINSVPPNRLCAPCLERGRKAVGAEQVGGQWMCRACFMGYDGPDDPRILNEHGPRAKRLEALGPKPVPPAAPKADSEPASKSGHDVLDGLDEWREVVAAATPEQLNVGAVREPPTQNGEEKQMRRTVDPEEVRKLNQEGLDDATIAERMEVSRVAVGKVRRDLHLPSKGKRGAPHKGTALLQSVQRKAAQIETAIDPQITQIAQISEPAKANGHATARVVMFELSGDNASIMAAIDAVRAALSVRN